MERDPKIQAAYTEAEAKDAVVAAARDLCRDGGGSGNWAALRAALIAYETHKGVR